MSDGWLAEDPPASEQSARYGTHRPYRGGSGLLFLDAHAVELHALFERECPLGPPFDLYGGEVPVFDEGRSFFRRRDLIYIGRLLVGARERRDQKGR